MKEKTFLRSVKQQYFYKETSPCINYLNIKNKQNKKMKMEISLLGIITSQAHSTNLILLLTIKPIRSLTDHMNICKKFKTLSKRHIPAMVRSYEVWKCLYILKTLATIECSTWMSHHMHFDHIFRSDILIFWCFIKVFYKLNGFGKQISQSCC